MSDKKEVLLEKELVLEEVVSLTKKLRKQAADGRAETLLLSKKVVMKKRWSELDAGSVLPFVRAYSAKPSRKAPA